MTCEVVLSEWIVWNWNCSPGQVLMANHSVMKNVMLNSRPLACLKLFQRKSMAGPVQQNSRPVACLKLFQRESMAGLLQQNSGPVACLKLFQKECTAVPAAAEPSENETCCGRWEACKFKRLFGSQATGCDMVKTCLHYRLDHSPSRFHFSNKAGTARQFGGTHKEKNMFQTRHALQVQVPGVCQSLQKLLSSRDFVRGFSTANLPHVHLSAGKSVPSLTTQGFHTTTSNQQAHQDASTSTKLESEEDVGRLAEEVIQKASQLDVMVRSVPVSQVEHLVVDLHRCGCQASDIASLLSTRPGYIRNHRKLLPTIHLLLSHGLDLKQVITILHQFPPIVKVRPNQLTQVVEALRECGFREKSIAKVLTGNPAVLQVAKATVHKRVGALRQLFRSADVITLVVGCPQVLTDKWEEIQARFDYVFHEMNITQKQMVYATLFSHSLSHIKKRHAFLVRAGLFNQSKRAEGERSPNARLDQIITTSDEAFARTFGGFGVDEYRTFCQLFDKENAGLADSDSDDDTSGK